MLHDKTTKLKVTADVRHQWPGGHGWIKLSNSWCFFFFRNELWNYNNRSRGKLWRRSSRGRRSWRENGSSSPNLPKEHRPLRTTDSRTVSALWRLDLIYYISRTVFQCTRTLCMSLSYIGLTLQQMFHRKVVKYKTICLWLTVFFVFFLSLTDSCLLWCVKVPTAVTIISHFLPKASFLLFLRQEGEWRSPVLCQVTWLLFLNNLLKMTTVL